MNAIIHYKKLKFWYDGLLENIIHGLIRQGFDVSITTEEPESDPDLYIKWHRDLEGLEYFRNVLLLELGWFDRRKNLLLFDKNDIRFEPTLQKKYSRFYHGIDNVKSDRWIILGQMDGDKNLLFCSDYSEWIKTVTAQLKEWGDYPVYFRPNPAADIPPEHDLVYDLSRAVGVVSWNSSGVLKAMMHGIPICIYDFPEIEKACQKGLTKEWVEKVEENKFVGKYFKDYKDVQGEVLNYVASQQISIADFRELDYKSYMFDKRKTYQHLYDTTDYSNSHRNSAGVRYYDFYKEWINGNIFDWGCGNGVTIEFLREKGFTATGMDWVKFDNDLLVDDITESHSKKCDTAICIDVLEHVDDRKIDGLLKNISNSKKQAINISNGSSVVEGEELHINKKPFEEWEKILKKYFIIKKIIRTKKDGMMYLTEAK